MPCTLPTISIGIGLVGFGALLGDEGEVGVATRRSRNSMAQPTRPASGATITGLGRSRSRQRSASSTAGLKVVHRDIEEALDGGGMQVAGEDAVGPGGLK